MIKKLLYKYEQLHFLKQISITAIILIILFSAYYVYKLKKNEYLIDPNHPLYTQYEWNSWEDSVGGKLAHDPKWLAMIPDKYIPEEIPFEFSFMEKIEPAYIRRWKYFEHLCETERVSYTSMDYPKNKIIDTFIYINRGELPVKGMKKLYDTVISEKTTKREKEKTQRQIRDIWTITQQNPYFYSLRFSTIPLFKEGQLYDLSLNIIDKNYYIKNEKKLPTKTTFREYLDDEGYVWRINYDAEIKQYLPIEKDTQIKAKYNIFSKKSQNEEMKKLGIWKVEKHFL